MMDGFNVVSVGIEKEGGVIAGMVVGSLSRRSIVLAPGLKARSVDFVYRFMVLGLECDVMTAGELTRRLGTIR